VPIVEASEEEAEEGDEEGFTMNQRRSVVSVAAGLFAVLPACGSHYAPGPKHFASGDLTTAEYEAAYRIATARCERQTAACSSYASRDACVRAKLVPSAADARLEQCNQPVDDAKVEACVAAIRGGACGTGITAIAACRQSAICPYVPEEGTL
jgi:hypothetical protein